MPIAWKPPSTWIISPVIAARQVREQERDDVADRLGSVVSHPSGARCAPRVGDLVEPGDALAGHRADRAGAHGVDADAVGPEVPREVAGRRPRGRPWRRPSSRRSATRPARRSPGHDRAAVGFHQREHARRRSPSARTRSSGSRSRPTPTGCGGSCRPARPAGANAMACSTPSTAPPPGRQLRTDRVDLLGVVRIHLEDVAGRRQPLGGLLREAHRPAEVGQHDLGAVLLRGSRGGERDRLRREHAGDQELLPVQQHGARA